MFIPGGLELRRFDGQGVACAGGVPAAFCTESRSRPGSDMRVFSQAFILFYHVRQSAGFEETNQGRKSRSALISGRAQTSRDVWSFVDTEKVSFGRNRIRPLVLRRAFLII